VNSPPADTRGNAASGAFSANGLRPAQNNYLLDGIDNNSDTVDFLNGTNYVVLPPVDAIQEFKVQTSDFSAEFGRSGAAFSMPPSSPVRTNFTDRVGNSSATNIWMPRTSLRMPTTSRRAFCSRTSLEPPLADR